jgi:peptidyl-prolyl cis-trans isomerase B (cyclophilin B)
MTLLAVIALLAFQAVKPAPGNPVVVFETAKGVIEIELFAKDAPKSTEQIVRLVRENFYRGHRFHRAEAGLVQTGDPNSKTFSKQNLWGSGGSGRQIGVAEISKTRKHVRGAVALAHSGNAARADSQFYIMKRASPSLDGKHAVIGRVIAGMDVVDKLQVGDLITRVSVKAGVPQP